MVKRRHRRSNPRGEWWITRDGEALFADGDVGPLNHELVVVDYLTHQIMGSFNLDHRLWDEEYIGDLDNYLHFISDELYGHRRYKMPTLKADVIKHLAKFYGSREQAKEAWFVARNAQGYDPRDYAIKYLRWIRMADDYVQMWTGTRRDFKQLVDGMLDAYEERELMGEHFNINIIKARRIYEWVPLVELLKESPRALLPYRSDY